MGALLNVDNVHWTAIVKHSARLWLVDSCKALVLLDDISPIATLQANPNAYALVDRNATSEKACVLGSL